MKCTHIEVRMNKYEAVENKLSMAARRLLRPIIITECDPD